VGTGSRTMTGMSVAIGGNGYAAAPGAMALGFGARAFADDSVAIGMDSIADQADTVSVGSADHQRRIVNVADGIAATDAVNLSQLQSALATANAYTDSAVATGSTAANAYTDDREAAIRGDMVAGDAQTLSEANAYSDDREVAIRDDMATGDAQTLSAANAYTDNRINALPNVDLAPVHGRLDALEDRFLDVENRFQRTDRRIDQQGAMAAAMANLSSSGSGLAGSNRVGVGVGVQNGASALAVGYQRMVNRNFGISISGAFSGGDRAVGGGASLSW